MTQDEDDIRKQNQLRQQVEYQRAEKDFAAVVDTPEGRRFIKRLLGECSVYQSTFTGEALTTSHREGKRAIGQHGHQRDTSVDSKRSQRPDHHTLNAADPSRKRNQVAKLSDKVSNDHGDDWRLPTKCLQASPEHCDVEVPPTDSSKDSRVAFTDQPQS